MANTSVPLEGGGSHDSDSVEEEGHWQARAVYKYWAPAGAEEWLLWGAADPNARDLDLILTSKSGFHGCSAALNARDLDLIRRLAVVGASGLKCPCWRELASGLK